MAYPEKKSHTVTVTTAAAANFVCPTDADTLVAAKNISANAIWVNHTPGGAATVEGGDCEAILAGETVYLLWRGQQDPYSFRAATADSKLVLTNAMGRM
jgi:hypothetical protein